MCSGPRAHASRSGSLHIGRCGVSKLSAHCCFQHAVREDAAALLELSDTPQERPSFAKSLLLTAGPVAEEHNPQRDLQAVASCQATRTSVYKQTCPIVFDERMLAVDRWRDVEDPVVSRVWGSLDSRMPGSTKLAAMVTPIATDGTMIFTGEITTVLYLSLAFTAITAVPQCFAIAILVLL